MSGLLAPVSGPVTQGFAGTNKAEFPGYLGSNAGGPRLARKVAFTNGVYYPKLHGAIDQGVPSGTKVLAPERGIVIAHGQIGRLADGRWDGEIYVFLLISKTIGSQTLFFATHLSKNITAIGQHVAKGQPLALSGNSGWSTDPHVHWEILTGPPDLGPLTSWGNRWTRWNGLRLLTGGDMATAQIIVPNT